MKKMIAALVFATVGISAHASHNSCAALKHQIGILGWDSIKLNATHSLVVVARDEDCFDSKQKAFLEPIQVGGETCWLNICANDAFSADSYIRSGRLTDLNP